MSLKIIQNGTPVEATKIWIGGEIQAECLRVWSTEANTWVYEALAELTGTLPLTFRSNGTALIDYRIYGNTLTTKLNLWEWGNTNYRIDLTTPIAANTTLTYAVFKDGIADRAEGIYLYDANGSRILNAPCANTNGSRIYATATPTRDVHRIELSPMAADALRMLTEGDTPPDEYVSPETTDVQGVGVRTENLFDPNAAEEDGDKIISDFMPLDPSELVLTMAFDIPLRASYNYEIAYYDSTKTAISFVGGMGEAYKTRETVKLNRQSEAPNAAYVKVTLPKDLTNVLIQNGSTSGEFIPYGYKLPMVSRTENAPYHRAETPIYIGDTQLMQDEYVSYGEQAIYKRTENLFDGQGTDNFGYYVYNSGQYIDDKNAKYWRFPVKEGDIIRWTTTGAGWGCVFFNGRRVGYFKTGDTPFTVPANVDEITNNFKSSAWDSAMVTKNQPLPTSYAPYFKPTDPPVPLPELPTFSDTATVLDYEETPAPEEVWVKYHKK